MNIEIDMLSLVEAGIITRAEARTLLGLDSAGKAERTDGLSSFRQGFQSFPQCFLSPSSADDPVAWLAGFNLRGAAGRLGRRFHVDSE